MIIANKQFEDPSINIVTTAKCKTLSGKSTLTYHLGLDIKQNAFLRVHSNTNNGFFSNEWVALDDILAILEKQTNPFTSIIFYDLFTGLSVNTPAFFSAVLLNEKVLEFAVGKRRKYVYSSGSVATLLERINKLGTAKASKKKAVKRS